MAGLGSTANAVYTHIQSFSSTCKKVKLAPKFAPLSYFFIFYLGTFILYLDLFSAFNLIGANIFSAFIRVAT
jgi:hypothetical protein